MAVAKRCQHYVVDVEFEESAEYRDYEINMLKDNYNDTWKNDIIMLRIDLCENNGGEADGQTYWFKSVKARYDEPEAATTEAPTEPATEPKTEAAQPADTEPAAPTDTKAPVTKPVDEPAKSNAGLIIGIICGVAAAAAAAAVIVAVLKKKKK